MSVRVLYTGALIVLGLGYMFAALYLFGSHSGRDGKPTTLSVQDIVIAYSGSKEGTRLETALRGPMAGMLPVTETGQILGWVQRGADEAEYEKDIRPILDRRCLACHDGSNPHLPNLDGHENLMEVVVMDTGADVFTLVRVSHIHLFGLTFIFFIAGLIFSHAYVRPVWFKCAVVATPFVCIALDVSSWYFTKLFNPMAWVVLLSGAFMGLSFAFMWVVAMYQLWFGAVPGPVAEREADLRSIG
ncbi:MAG: hypothetical protein OES46_21170 [Gammaproteobacteria bacterium]|nr:hypothetical protein [Gammaproteobacteria bacterium]